MPVYEIDYAIPETDGDHETITGEYDSYMWAEDHAYALADKGWYKITRIGD